MNRRKIKRLGKKVYQTGGQNTFDNNGYLDSNKDNFTPMKVIEGDDITMDGVSMGVIAMPTDDQGNIIGMKFMKPGEDYNFSNAEQVVEFPQYKEGGKSKWISNKISKLIDEGYDRERAIGAAYGMWEQEHKNGGTQRGYYQQAGQVSDPFTSFGRSVSAIRWPWEQNQTQISQQNYMQRFDLPGAFNMVDPTYETFQRTGYRLPTAELESSGLIQPYQNTYLPDLPLYQPSNINIEQTTNVGGEDNEDVQTRTPDMSQFAVTPQAQQKLQTSPEGYVDFSQEAIPDSQAGAYTPYEGSSNIPTPRYQFVNPYAGIDIPTSAVLFGESLEAGDTGMSIASGAKLGLGVARNIFSGIGQRRRNQFVADEYNRRQRDAMNRPVYAQNGAEITREEAQGLSTQIAPGFEFTPDWILDNVERAETPQIQPRTSLDFGKYRDLNYFRELPSTENGRVIVENTDANPHNQETLNNLYPYLREQNPNTDFELRYRPRNTYRKGGKVDEAALLNGEYITGNEQRVGNAEVEDKEIIKSPQGQVMEVAGNTHDNGGEVMNLEENTKILSEHLKLGGDNAKKLRQDFDLEVKAKDSYSDVKRIFDKKSGLQKITEEQEKVIKELEKQNQKLESGDADESTIGVNIEFLSGKLYELEQQAAPLKEARKAVFDVVFEMQEGSKPKEQQEEVRQEFQIGGKVYNEDIIRNLSKERGIEFDRAVELIQSYHNSPKKYQNAGEVEALTNLFGNIGFANEYTNEDQISSIVNDFGNQYNTNFSNYFTVEEGKGGVERIVPTQQAINIYNNNQTPATSNPNPATASSPTETDTIAAEQTREAVQTASALPDIERSYGTEITAPSPEEINRVIRIETPTTVDENSLREGEGPRSGILPLPDQSPLPPEALQPHLMVNRSYDRIDPVMRSPDAAIAEIRRGAQAAEAQLSQLPDSQRRAAITQLQANVQNQINKVISDVETYNAQATQQAGTANAQIQMREEDMGATDALSFEQRQLGAVAKTQQDYRNYINALQRTGVANFNTVNQFNLMNQLFDNFQFTGQGVERVGEGPDFGNIEDRIRTMQALNASRNQTAKDGGKITKKKSRGRFKK